MNSRQKRKAAAELHNTQSAADAAEKEARRARQREIAYGSPLKDEEQKEEQQRIEANVLVRGLLRAMPIWTEPAKAKALNVYQQT